MIIYQLIFSGDPIPDEEKPYFLIDVHALLNTLNRHNQIIYKDNIVSFTADKVFIFVSCPGEEIISSGLNIYAKKWISNIEEDYSLKFSIEKIGNYPGDLDGSYSEASAYILYGNSYMPLRSFDNFDPIPLYKFPYTYSDNTSYFDINMWLSNYNDVYAIWDRGDINEPYFKELLSSFESELTVKGMEICLRIKQLTNKDCYFYLFNYDNDVPDACPSCGGPWKLENRILDKFDFKCDKCNILSNLGVD